MKGQGLGFKEPRMDELMRTWMINIEMIMIMISLLFWNQVENSIEEDKTPHGHPVTLSHACKGDTY